MAMVQFVHRTLALAILAGAWLLAWRVHADRAAGAEARLAAKALALATAAQVALGIATLLMVVPVGLGTAHQGGAVVVLACALWLARALR